LSSIPHSWRSLLVLLSWHIPSQALIKDRAYWSHIQGEIFVSRTWKEKVIFFVFSCSVWKLTLLGYKTKSCFIRTKDSNLFFHRQSEDYHEFQKHKLKGNWKKEMNLSEIEFTKRNPKKHLSLNVYHFLNKGRSNIL
jgi:hypothetical protein